MTEPVLQAKPKLIARDEKTQRVIVGIGSQRIAFDIFTRVTHLPPCTGDQPAAVLPLNATRDELPDGKRVPAVHCGKAKRNRGKHKSRSRE